ncbi:DUF202 domain-containing protein [Streptococcus cameli]
MKQDELVQGYKQEIDFQKRMLENLQRWFSLALCLVGICLVIWYYFASDNRLVTIISLFIGVISFLIMLLIGYAIYKGRKNLQLVIDDFQRKVSVTKHES